MRKFILGLISASILSSSLVAQCTLKPQYPGSGPAPKAYCWDVIAVESAKAGLEYTYQASKTITDKNHEADFYYTNNYKNVFLAYVDVYGYGKQPDVQMNYKYGMLYSTTPLQNQYKIIIGYRYTFIVPQDTSEAKGWLDVKEYAQVKDRLYIR